MNKQIQYKLKSITEAECLFALLYKLGWNDTGCGNPDKLQAMANEWVKHYPYVVFYPEKKRFGGNEVALSSKGEVAQCFNTVWDMIIESTEPKKVVVPLDEFDTAEVSKTCITINSSIKISFSDFDRLAKVVAETRQ